jgi:hypothetical protein
MLTLQIVEISFQNFILTLEIEFCNEFGVTFMKSVLIMACINLMCWSNS